MHCGLRMVGRIFKEVGYIYFSIWTGTYIILAPNVQYQRELYKDIVLLAEVN